MRVSFRILLIARSLAGLFFRVVILCPPTDRFRERPKVDCLVPGKLEEVVSGNAVDKIFQRGTKEFRVMENLEVPSVAAKFFDTPNLRAG